MLDVEKLEVVIRVDRKPGEALKCPECGQTCPGYDSGETRRWRHLDSMQFMTYLEAALPRCQCPEHGVRSTEVPWAKQRDRFTLLFSAFAIQVLLSCRNIRQATRLLRLDWKAAHRIMESAVEHGLTERDLSGLRKVGMDEKMVRCGVGFASVLCDVERGHIIEMTPGRTQAAAEACWKPVPREVAEKVACAAVDMSAAYQAAVRKQAPNAEVVVDKFHVAQLMNQAVDNTRRQEQEERAKEGHHDLKHTRYLWLFDPNHLTDDQCRRFEEAFAVARKTAKAWTLKEALAEMWMCPDRASAAEYFRRWHVKAVRSGLPDVARVARSLKRNLQGILAYFTHWISNAGAEGLNSLIQSLQSAARGYRNFANLRVAALFFHGGLTLSPNPFTHWIGR